jgi:hypothetical protein
MIKERPKVIESDHIDIKSPVISNSAMWPLQELVITRGLSCTKIRARCHERQTNKRTFLLRTRRKETTK